MDCRLTAMLVLAGLLSGSGSALAAGLPEPITTNKMRFRIPFKIEQAAIQRLNPRELQLHVTRDHGVTWELSQTIPPDGAKFEYQAPGDGEYWFAVKTLDGRGQLNPPAGRYETGLVVLVDTTPPLLELSLQQLPSGKVQLSWNAADAHLDASTLKLEYLQPGNQDWEPVEVTARSSGQISWSVAKQGVVKVRGSIGDTATNVGKAEGQVQLTAISDPAPKPKPTRRVPIAGLNAEQAANRSSPDESAAPIVANAPSAFLPGANAPTTKAPSNRQEPASPPKEDDQDFQGPVITPFGGGSIATSPPSSSERLVTSNSNSRPEITKDRWGDSEEETAVPPAKAKPDSQVRPESSRPEPSRIESPRFGANRTEAARSEPETRSAGNRKIVSSRRFQLGYTVDDVGPSGISTVELFITTDQGRKWYKYGDDLDRRSPFDVEVPQDGEYGFSIRVRSGVGLTNDPPMPGEPPSILVSVDQTPPTVELLSAQQGTGANSNRVCVRWRIADEHLSSRPVAVYSAPTRAGPWEPISGWTDDQGSFEWTVTPGSAPQFYVRVVARDIAGNTSKAESAQPILVDLARPTARIVDIEGQQSIGPK